MSLVMDPKAEKAYECEACLLVSPAASWGPGWITCPHCGFVARTVFERRSNLRPPTLHRVVLTVSLPVDVFTLLETDRRRPLVIDSTVEDAVASAVAQHVASIGSDE